MTDLAIDTHRFVKQLMESGFTEAQAETLADAQMQLLASRMATKEDIHDLHSRIDAFEASMDARFKASEANVEARFNAFEANVDARFNAFEASMDARFKASEANVDARFKASEASMDGKINALRSDFSVLLIRSQITTGAAIITILSFINYLTG